MQADLENLRITKQEVEAFVDSDTKTILALEFYRGFILKDSKQMLSVILTEMFLFIILLSFVMPVSLILLRNAGTLPNHPADVIRLFSLIFGICSLGMLLWNIHLWQQVKQVKSLAKLLDKVDKYNDVIRAIALIDQLEAAGSSASRFSSPKSRQEVIEAMRITKETLSSALKMEKLIRKYHDSIGNYHEVFANLEENIVALMSFDMSDRVNEYSQLLNESLQIGLSVHQEVKKLKFHPSEIRH